MYTRRRQPNENTSFFNRKSQRSAAAHSSGVNSAFAARASNPNTFRARVNRSIERHPYLWAAAKWLAVGAVAATVLYFSGGLAAIPFIAPAVAELGGAIIAVAAPILAATAAALWHGIAKPIGNFFRKLFSSRTADRSAAVLEDPVQPQRPVLPQLQPQNSVAPQNLRDFELPSDPRSSVSPVVNGASSNKYNLPSSPALTPSLPPTVPPRVATSSTLPPSLSQPPLNSAKLDLTREEQKQDQQASSSGLGSSPSRDVALTLKGAEVDLSYMYDALTIYPKSTGEITGIAACIEKCKELDFIKAQFGPFAMLVQPDSPRTSARTRKASNCMTQIKGSGGAQFSRYIYRDADDHDLYHQDSFVIDRSHYHLKFNRAITEDQFSQMIFIFAAESLITGDQAGAYIRAFSQRNREARAALDAVCVRGDELASPQDKKQQNKQAILKFISTCRSNDVLIDLHEYLLDPKFDYLREITEMHPSKEWQGTDRHGAVVKTSKAWAQLEKGISLQMIKNIKDKASKFSPALGTERSKQLADSHRFFGIKRTRSIASPHAPRTYKTLNAFSRADEDRLDRKYNKIFRPS